MLSRGVSYIAGLATVRGKIAGRFSQLRRDRKIQPMKARSKEDPANEGEIGRRSSQLRRDRKTIQPMKARSEDDPAN
ncbi:hypothetical protein RF55_20542 [Lasius niger]|uniref:Uncharacterized protein n=1 Tax=Lasius niger TaxID=67767 RepID=A0A0J7MRW0_LASNI|nr:hypothetical protein RF55_20542 [Lasius niger]